MSGLCQILAEKMENKNHEGLLKHPVYFTRSLKFVDVGLSLSGFIIFILQFRGF